MRTLNLKGILILNWRSNVTRFDDNAEAGYRAPGA